MKESILCICFALSLTLSIWHLPGPVYAQVQPTAKSSLQNTSEVSASVMVQVKNETITGVLTPAVFTLINSGASIFKTTDSDKLNVKTKINNEINNVTQNVVGTDAALAIIGIEIGSAVKTVISSADKHNQTGIITIETSSMCKLLAVKSIACENTIRMKSS
jgi:hypothetical protein